MTRETLEEPGHPSRPDRGFADRLREATGTVHRQAERSGFIADLIRGRATVSGYALFLRNLAPAYGALETQLAAHARTRVLEVFADPRLRRLAALEADLAAIAGDGWTALPVLDSARAYAAAIDEAAEADPLRLAAHAYARYLGDLSGGQILKPVLARTLKLGADALGFYDFPALADLAAAKARMREALEAIPTDGPQADAVIAEAIAAFRHNIAVSEAVQAAV